MPQNPGEGKAARRGAAVHAGPLGPGPAAGL